VGEGKGADRGGLRPDVDADVGEAGPQRRLHLLAHRLGQRLAARPCPQSQGRGRDLDRVPPLLHHGTARRAEARPAADEAALEDPTRPEER